MRSRKHGVETSLLAGGCAFLGALKQSRFAGHNVPNGTERFDELPKTPISGDLRNFLPLFHGSAKRNTFTPDPMDKILSDFGARAKEDLRRPRSRRRPPRRLGGQSSRFLKNVSTSREFPKRGSSPS